MRLDNVAYIYTCNICGYKISKDQKYAGRSVHCPNCNPTTPKIDKIIKKVVVTRHKTLVDYLMKKGLIDEDTEVLSFASPRAIQNKHVIGKLPVSMAKHATKYTEVRLRTPEEKKGKELTLDELEFYIVSCETYVIRGLD